MNGLGEQLNVVRKANPWPTCRSTGQLAVHENAVRWLSCGHIRDLPSLPVGNRPKKEEAK